MGQVIGKIMPLPKGEYDPTVVYNVIDLVTHNNCLWIAKKSDIVGVEPSEENSEYWMLAVKDNTEWQQLCSELLARDTVLPMTTISAGSTEEEINNFYDNYSASMTNGTYYNVLIGHGVSHSILGGSKQYLEGCKISDLYEWQTTKCYIRAGVNEHSQFTRSKINGTWTPWNAVDIGNVLTANKNVYVDATNGNDTTGDGTQTKPWATIQKAVNECPSVEGTNTMSIPLYLIYIANGEYNEVINIYGKNVYFITNETEPSVTINGNIIIGKKAIVEIRLPLSIQVQNTGAHAITVMHNSFLYTTKAITLVGTGCTNNRSGLEIQTASSALINGALTVKDCTTGVSSNHVSRVFCLSVAIENCTTALNANTGGILKFSAITLLTFTNVTNQYATSQGGRILAGTQGWQTIGSVTGANSIDFSAFAGIYTEYLVEIRYLTYSASMIIPADSFNSSKFLGNSSFSGKINTSSSKVYLETKSISFNSTDVTDSTVLVLKGRRA